MLSGPIQKRMNGFAAWALVLVTLVATPVHAQSDTVQLKRPAELRAAPAGDAPSLVALPAQTSVTRLSARQGAWVQVRSSTGTTGWVHMFDLGSASPPSAVASTAAGALRGLTNFFNRGSAQGNNTVVATSTVGIRGLSSEDIANAQPNLAALSQAEGLRMDAAQARRFAAEAPLSVRTVEALPAPTAPQGAGSAEYKP